MDNGLEYDVFKRCVHKIKSCRHCHIIPLLSKDGHVVNNLVEHRTRNNQLIQLTIGTEGIRARKSLDLFSREEKFSRERIRNIPESSEGANDSAPSNEITIDPALQRMHMDDSILTEPESVEHLKSSLGSQLEQVQSQMKSSFSTPVVKQASRCIEQLVLLVAGLQYDTSLEAIVLRCVQFLSAITEGGIVLTLKDSLMKYAGEARIPDLLKGRTVKEIFEVEQAQPNTPEMLSSESLRVWETLKQGIFTKHLSYILGTVFAFSACKIKNVKFNHPIYEKIAEHATADEIDGMDLIDHAIKLYNWTATVGMACLESRSLAPLTINTTTLATCHEKFYHWQKKFTEYKRTGRSTTEERQLMFVEVETVYKTLETFTKTHKEKFLTLQASSLHREVLALYNDVRDFVHKVDRVKVAMGFHLYGVPKCGKSTIVPLINEQICLARGVEYRPEDNAQINLLAAFQDELSNSTQTITINESIPIKEHLAKSIEVAYNTALALVDCVPLHPNRSSLEEKSRNTMVHIAVVSTGNRREPFEKVANDKGAWSRRYRIIEQSVKDQYADEFGRIVSSKCDGSDDYHLFDVYEVVYSKGERHVVYYDMGNKNSLELDTRELMELIRRLSIDHFAEQDKLERSWKSEKVPGCLSCQRIGTMCVCPYKDAHTTAGVSIHNVEASVYSDLNTETGCFEGVKVGNMRSKCLFVSGECIRCERRESDDEDDDSEEEDGDSVNVPEMGVVYTAASTAGSLIWSSILPWVNPFIKAQWIWSIDNNLMRVFHEEIVEELSYWPDKFGCKALSLFPKSWETRADGTQSWFGKRKESYLRMMAAEKQIFLPLSYLFRRALCWGILTFIITMSFGYMMERCGLNPREYETVVLIEHEYTEWGWRYLYPEYSAYVFERRDLYASLGVFTEKYLDWRDYYVNIYFFEQLLGLICMPWLFTKYRWVPVLETRVYQWWLMPFTTSLCVCIGLFLFMWYRRWLGYEQRYLDLQKRSMSDPNLQKSLYDKARRHASEYNSLVPTAVGVIGAVVTGLMLWNSIRSTPEVEITRDNNTKSWSDWFSFNREVAEPVESKNSSADESANIAARTLTSVTATCNDKQRRTLAHYVRPGVLLITRHFFKVDPYKEELVDYLDLYLDTKGVKHKCRAYTKAMVRIPGKDSFLLKVPKAPKLPKAVDYMFPKKTGSDYIKARIIFLNHEGKPVTEKLNAKYESSVDSAGFSCGRGLSYDSKHTNIGFCGAILISDRRDGAILGIHVAGRPIGLMTRKGFAQEILYDDYKKALEELEAKPDYINTPEMKLLETNRLGIDLIPCEGAHPKTKMFVEGELDSHPSLEVLGHDPKLVRYRSRVRKSLISEAIERRCNVRDSWKAPCLKEPWKQHNKALKFVAEGAWEAPPDSLKWAVDDYWSDIQEPLRAHIAKHPNLCKPLTLDEAINGVPGSLYMGPFKMDTAAGIPSGPKSKSGLFEELPAYDDGRKRWGLTPVAQEMYDKMDRIFDNKETYGIWVRTCLKDETVKEDSDKVRIFYILECIFALKCRQYFLPIAEFISRHPLTTECLVGVNCAGPEWEETIKHINKWAVDFMLTDWDYQKYDIKRAPNVMIASLKLMIRMAEFMGYSERVLVQMRGIAEELRSPIVNWNGTIIWMYIWCSGNSMTVYGNSLENSLHQRISFHWNGMRELGEKKFHELGKFKDNEHIVTYGDDGVSGAKPEVRSICDFHAKKRYFDFINMGITDARKSDDPQSVVPSELVDFLKRKSVYHERLGCRVGALDSESIWKMGHRTSGSGEPEDLAIAAIQSMLTEAFLHGEEFYEDLRAKLQLVAGDTHIWTEVLERSYEDKVQMWHEKYSS